MSGDQPTTARDARLEALLRLLVIEGHVSPYGAREIRKLMEVSR